MSKIDKTVLILKKQSIDDKIDELCKELDKKHIINIIKSLGNSSKGSFVKMAKFQVDTFGAIRYAKNNCMKRLRQKTEPVSIKEVYDELINEYESKKNQDNG